MWKWLFDYTVPVVLKEEWNPIKVNVSLVLSPVVLWLTYGGNFVGI
jgi:hypothetical protein